MATKSFECYVNCLGKLRALMMNSVTILTLIAGDFNCRLRSRFLGEFSSFTEDNNLFMSDINRLKDVCMYISDDGLKMSWVDHVLSTASLDKLTDKITILNDVILSHHKPVSFSLRSNDSMYMTSDT